MTPRPAFELAELGPALTWIRAADVQRVETAAMLIAAAHASDVAHVRPSIRIGTAITMSTGGAGAPCDGDLPPCWRIVGTESGGRWDAYNPHGCSGTGCYGPYQFGGFWAGKLGLPADLTQATHEQWINAARALWAGGAGCSNWNAC